MCGWPFINSAVPMKAIAVPVPSLARYQDQSRYCSEFLARADSGFDTLEQSFGHRFGFMTQNSQSGFNAPRATLAPLAASRGGSLFSAVVGPLDTPARALAALVEREVDLIALDSFYLDLLRAHRPESLERVTTLALTAFTPMPLLVASGEADDHLVATVADALCNLHEKPHHAGLLQDVLVRRFERPDPGRYGTLDDAAAGALRLGYQVIR
jgi:ABC-type phosphate/phosphonate transport system substrate-binding protein